MEPIPAWKVKVIRAYLKMGIAQKEIAEELGVGVVTVGRISTAKPTKKRDKPKLGKCDECGGMVYLPCLACRVEAQEKLNALRGRPEYDELEFDLRGEDKKRHEELLKYSSRGLPTLRRRNVDGYKEAVEGPDQSDMQPGDDEWFDRL